MRSVRACPVVRPARAARYLVSATMHRRVQTASCTGLENEERRRSEGGRAGKAWCGQRGGRGIWRQLRCIGDRENEEGQFWERGSACPVRRRARAAGDLV